MIDINKKSDQFKTKLNNNPSVIEKTIYLEALSMLENDVNPDKTQNWVDNVLSIYNNKPKPLSEKDKKSKADKVIKKQAKLEKLVMINDKFKTLLNNYGVYIIGFFDWNELSESQYNLIQKLAAHNGYVFTDIGDGALEPYISKKPIDTKFISELNSIRNEYDLINKSEVFSSNVVTDVDVFINKLMIY